MARTFGLILTAIAALTALALSPAISQEEHSWQFSELSGNRIAWSCTGTGEPTMIMITGSGLTAHESFGRAYHSYKGPGRVCMYDRAGIGKSTFNAPKTRNLDQLAEELRGVVQAASLGKTILIPHSFGGYIARAYAAKYPDDARGILFLDVAHEDWLPNLKAKLVASDWAIFESILAINDRDYHEDYWQAQEAVRSMRLPADLPITVITRGVPHTTIRRARLSDAAMDLYESEHRSLQTKIAALSRNSEHRVARYASHIFDDYDPWLVADEIERMSKRVSK